MGGVRRSVLTGVVGLTLAASAGCGAKQSLSSPAGASAGQGQDAGARGGAGGRRTRDGGGQGLAGGDTDGAMVQGGAATETTCLGDGGWTTPLDGGPTAADGGVCQMLAPDPPTFPWDQAHLPPRDGGASGSGCQTSSSGGQVVDVVCSGDAWLSANGGAAPNVPTLTWDDGSSLSWNATGLDPSFPPLIAPGAADQRVWAQMESHGWLSVPGQCGWSWDQTMDLRDSPGGPIRFTARQGASIPEPTSAELAALFGVGALATTACTHDAVGGPALFRQTLQDHVLQTDPPQLVPYAQPTRVTTPNGTFQVLWYSRSQVARPLSTTCAGCLNQGPTVGLVAARIAAP